MVINRNSPFSSSRIKHTNTAATLIQSQAENPQSAQSEAAETRPALQRCQLSQMLETKARQRKLQAEQRRLARQTENMRRQIESQREQLRIMRLVAQIASRIMRGDNVPQSDKDFLLEHSPGKYKLAMSARNLNNDDPKDYQALAREDAGQRQTFASAGVFSGGAAGKAASSGPPALPSSLT